MKKPLFAFLIYSPLKKRRKNNSFIGNGNIGAFVVKDILERSGYEVGWCVPDTAHKYDIVLISLTSTQDLFALYRAVAALSTWQRNKRTFSVWAGGFGMQNPTAVREYIDWAFFGRVDDWLCDIAVQLIAGGYAEHRSLMDTQKMNNVEIGQATNLYEATNPYGEPYVEEFTGCPLKCKFCHYTFARKYKDNRATKGSYVQTSLTNAGTPEVVWDRLLTWDKKAGRVRTAIDGCSERMRKLYGKGFITNDKIVEGIERMGSFEGNTVLLIFNIGNFPYETDDDRMEIEEILRRAKPKHRIVFVLYTTPFRPSLATPMQWEGVNVAFDWSKHRSRVIVDDGHLRAVHAYTNETPWSHFSSVMAERMESQHDEMWHQVCMSHKFEAMRSEQKMDLVFDRWKTDWVLAERDIESPPPAPFLSGYLDNDILRKIARKMRQQARLN